MIGVPILVGPEVVAVLCFFSRRPMGEGDSPVGIVAAIDAAGAAVRQSATAEAGAGWERQKQRLAADRSERPRGSCYGLNLAGCPRCLAWTQLTVARFRKAAGRLIGSVPNRIEDRERRLAANVACPGAAGTGVAFARLTA